jgi:hypothetical protein
MENFNLGVGTGADQPHLSCQHTGGGGIGSGGTGPADLGNDSSGRAGIVFDLGNDRSGASRISVSQASLPVYDRILNLLTDQFEQGRVPKNQPHLVGLIFGQPFTPLVKEQIMPILNYWHHRSAAYIDFFCVGFSAKSEFNAEEYNHTLEAFEKNTKWERSGGTDLILVNALYSQETRRATLSFSDVLALTLEDVVKVAGYEYLGIFFEKVISAAQKANDKVSPSIVSDELGKRLGKSAFRGVVTGLLPEGAKQEALDAFLFAVKNISKKQQK